MAIFLAQRETRGLFAAHATFTTGQQQRPPALAGRGIDQQLTVVKRQPARGRVIGNIHRGIGVQPELRAISQAQIAHLTNRGPLIGRPLSPGQRSAGQAQCRAATKHGQHLQCLATVRLAAVQHRAGGAPDGIVGQRLELATDAFDLGPRAGMFRLFQPRVPGLALASAGRTGLQHGKPFRRFLQHAVIDAHQSSATSSRQCNMA